MTPEIDGRDVCSICGRETDAGRWFCHFYSERTRVTFCSPACAEAFLHRPAPGERNGYGEWLAERAASEYPSGNGLFVVE